jgi:ABC-type multidrug transport system fused ATPase/permease subunit
MNSISRKVSEFLRFLGPTARRLVAISAISSCAVAALEVALSGFLVLFFMSANLLEPGKNIPRILQGLELTSIQICIALLCISLVKAVVQIAISQANFATGECVSRRLRLICIYEMLLVRPSRYISTSVVNMRIVETFPRATVFVQSISALLAAAIQILGITAVLIKIAHRELLLACGLLCLAGALGFILNRRIKLLAKQAPIDQEKLFFSLERNVRNWLLVRIFRTEGTEHRHLTDAVFRYSYGMRKLTFFAHLNNALMPFYSIFIVAVLVIVNQTIWQISGTNFVACLYLLMRLSQSIGSAMGFVTSATENYYYARDAMKFYLSFENSDRTHALLTERDISFSGKIKVHPGSQVQEIYEPAKATVPPSLSVKDVAFAYDKNVGSNVLESIFLTSEPGMQLGVIGPSGSGKSTLLALILGLINPDRGEIRLDGEDPAFYVASNASRIGYVGPDQFLFSGSVRDNLLFGNYRKVENDEIYAALESAKLDLVVEKLPGGLEYRIEENGGGLSTGQIQRLGLARAILRQPILLILDEVSANLDEATEAEIAASIRQMKGKCSVIIVTHRAGMLRYCDKMLDIRHMNKIS